jgi:protein-tyrosine phosphatase
LAETFKLEEQRRKFERWRNCRYIVVYDGNSAKPKDALVCMSMIKKFVTEGWTGQSYIIQGGFQEFAKQFPNLARNNSVSSGSPDSPSASSESRLSSIAPVIGGCPMPSTKSAANPFFGNIRQNMDLIGGVGQMAVTLPSFLGTQQEARLPKWLREAADSKDCGKLVSEKFLQIEKSEQKRMQEALSSSVTYGTPGGAGSAKPIQIAGIEKGVKNRYNNIWPYEHSRVRLEGVVDGECDYVNANHVKAAWSNKRYVATQGPVPATFAVSTMTRSM